MTQLEPAELSAYLDGEVDAARALEIAAIIAASPSLADELDTLSRHDAAWRMSARSATFHPVVRLRASGTARLSAPYITALVGLLMVIGVAAKTQESFFFAIAANVVAAAMVSIGVLVLARAEFAREPDACRVT